MSQQPPPHVPLPGGPAPWPGVPGAQNPVRPGAGIKALARARRNTGLYGVDHPVAAGSVAEAFEALSETLRSRSPARIVIYEDTFYLGRTVLLEESLRLGWFMVELVERQIGMLEFHVGLELRDIQHLVEVLNLRPPELLRLGGAAAVLRQRDAQHITASSGRPAGDDERREIQVDPRDVYRAGLRVVDELYFQASRAIAVDVKKASVIVSSLLDVMTQDRTALLGVAALKLYDEDTAHHSVSVAVLSLLIGQRLGLERGQLMPLGLAALLHDIGRVRFPREMFEDPDALAAAERERLRRHTLYGAHLLRNLPGLSRLAMVVAFEHHANFNLSGYPAITAKTSPHPFTRIVGVADFYDAATASTRPDGPPMLPAEAVTCVLDYAGTAFDPVAAEALVAVVGRYPVGSVVELADGSLAVVMQPGSIDPGRPVVKVVADQARRPVAPQMVNLEDHPGLRIAGALDPAGTPVDLLAHLQT